MRGPTIPIVFEGCNEICYRITHSPIGEELERKCEHRGSEEFTPWDYKAKKRHSRNDGIIAVVSLLLG